MPAITFSTYIRVTTSTGTHLFCSHLWSPETSLKHAALSLIITQSATKKRTTVITLIRTPYKRWVRSRASATCLDKLGSCGIITHRESLAYFLETSIMTLALIDRNDPFYGLFRLRMFKYVFTDFAEILLENSTQWRHNLQIPDCKGSIWRNLAHFLCLKVLLFIPSSWRRRSRAKHINRPPWQLVNNTKISMHYFATSRSNCARRR